MAEATASPLRVSENFHRFPGYRFVAGHDELGDAVTVVDDERFIRQVDQNDADFPPVVGVYCTRGVQQSDAFFQGESRARSYLSLVAGRQRDVQAGRYQTPP